MARSGMPRDSAAAHRRARRVLSCDGVSDTRPSWQLPARAGPLPRMARQRAAGVEAWAWPAGSRCGELGLASGRPAPSPCGLVAVLLGFGALQHQGVRGLRRHRAVLDALRHHEQLARAERDRVVSLQLDPEAPVPAQEEFVLVVVMPGELAIEPGD